MRGPMRITLWSALIMATLLAGCADLTDPDGSLHDRLVIASPVDAVNFVYQSLAEERLLI